MSAPGGPTEPPPPSTTKVESAPIAEQGILTRRFPRIASTVNKFSSSRTGRFSSKAWTYRRGILFGFVAIYTSVGYLKLKRDAYLRDIIHPETYLVWKIHDGAIVESKGPPTLGAILNAPASGEEAPRVMELFEIIRALKFAQRDERIKGIFADFSGLHLPSSVTPNRLGLAQIEELITAIHEFKSQKREQFGDKARPSIAWADSFDSQGSYLLASAFDEVWVQSAGQVPLTGMGAQIPFFKKVLEYFGVKVHAEARREYKSMVSTFNEKESLPPAQMQNEAELLGELNRGLMHAISVNRFPDADAGEQADKVEMWAKGGPFSSREATELGLINGSAFKRELVKRLIDPKHGGLEETKFKSLYHYNKVNDRHLNRQLNDDQILQVGVVYLLGTISNAPGEYNTSSVIKGLKEAAEDEDIKSIVLRIDSGGGDVVASESIWDAVKRVREDYGKPVVASFGNAAASGGYYAASAADAILACENTITGSIGVASLRPTITRDFFDRFNIGIQSFFTGSTASSSLHEMNPEQRERHSKHIDEMYKDFLKKVCDGRDISKEVIESLAGGRVMTGLSAWTRCNPDVEVEGGEDKGKKVKALSLTSEWKTSDVTEQGGNNTILIERVGANGREEEEQDDLVSRAEAALKTAFSIEAEEAPKQQGLEAVESAPGSPENPKLGPYGRGLVDTIGGIWDSAFYAMNMSVQKEISELVTQHNLTLEQATQQVRPGCEREIGEDGSVSLTADLRLVRFPEDKPFWKKVKELNAKGDEPQLFMMPRAIGNTLSVMADEVAKQAAKAALKMMIASALDPAGIAQAFDDKEMADRLQRSWTQSTRAKAEYSTPLLHHS